MNENNKFDVVGTNIAEKATMIWNVADMLRGPFKPHEYGLIILPMTVVKRFHDCLLSTHKAVLEKYEEVKKFAVIDGFLTTASQYQFYNISKYTFDSLLADPENIEANFRDYLNGFSANVQDVLSKFDFDNIIRRMVESNTLYLVIKEFNSQKGYLGPDKISAVDCGYIFEDLVKRFSESFGEEAGAHFTSRDIIYLMTDLLLSDADLSKGGNVTVYDMAMGTSQMLSCMEERIQELNTEIGVTNITNSWYRMDQMQIPAIYEDLFIIGLSIFALDKRVSRRRFKNCWTRDINVSIPVLEYDKWKDTGLQWEKMLGFLTGDHWHIVFRKSEVIYSYREHANRIHLNVQDCDCVCLFSGGLDSFCGAIRLLEEGGSPCLVGHNEYPKLAKRQNLFVRTFQDLYPEQSVKFISFTANSRAPISEKEGILKGSENTSRGRSLLFLCAALSVAGILGENVPVYIPENGFIGLNIPLTGGRKGTCSTRTTHPYFLRQFNGILEQVGIKNTITNFFAYNTKREIVGQVKDTDAFKSCYADTISCSHPCLARYNKKGSKEYPVNCGYCYPCLIRKSSLLDIDEIKKYSYQGEAYDFLIEYEESEKSADLRAVLGSIYRCKHSSDKELKRYIRCVGELTEEEVEKFLSLYKKSIEDLVQLFSADQRMKEYLGL